MSLKQRNIDPGVTNLNVEGTTLSLTFGGTDVKIKLASNTTKVWVDGVEYSRSGSPLVEIHVARILYEEKHFQEVNELQLAKYYSPSAAIEEVVSIHGFNFEGFRRQYYKRGGHKLKIDKTKGE